MLFPSLPNAAANSVFYSGTKLPALRGHAAVCMLLPF